MTTEYQKPLPRPLSPGLTKPFWDATKRHELVMPRCQKCDHFFFYPREECPKCLSPDIQWASVSGRGRLHTYRRPPTGEPRFPRGCSPRVLGDSIGRGSPHDLQHG